MGAQPSRVTTSKRAQIDQVSKEIRMVGNEIVRDALLLGWSEDDPTLCNRLHYFYKDILKQFNQEYLQNVNYQLGITIDSTFEQPPNIDALCTNILEYYRKKVEIVNYINGSLDSFCKDQERVISERLERMLEGATEQQRQEANKRLQIVNDIIYRFYSRIAHNLKLIQEDVTVQELDDLINDTSELIVDGATKCCIALDALRDFAWYEYVDDDGQVYYYNYYTEESTYDLPMIRNVGLSPIRNSAQLTWCQST